MDWPTSDDSIAARVFQNSILSMFFGQGYASDFVDNIAKECGGTMIDEIPTSSYCEMYWELLFRINLLSETEKIYVGSGYEIAYSYGGCFSGIPEDRFYINYDHSQRKVLEIEDIFENFDMMECIVANKGVVDSAFVADVGTLEDAIRLLGGFGKKSLSAFLLRTDSVELFYGSLKSRYPQAVSVAYSDLGNCMTDYAKGLFLRNPNIVDLVIEKELGLPDRSIIDQETLIDGNHRVLISIEQIGQEYNGKIKFIEFGSDSIWILSGTNLEEKSIISMVATFEGQEKARFNLFWNENGINGTAEYNGDVFSVSPNKYESESEFEKD